MNIKILKIKYSTNIKLQASQPSELHLIRRDLIICYYLAGAWRRSKEPGWETQLCYHHEMRGCVKD